MGDNVGLVDGSSAWSLMGTRGVGGRVWGGDQNVGLVMDNGLR